MSAFLFPIYVAIHFCVLLWCLSLWKRYRAPGAALTALIVAGLIYDNLIISLGASIGVGALLETLSLPRFVLHALATPLMMIAVTQIAAAGGIRWAETSRWRNFIAVLVVAMMLLGAYEGLVGLELVPACFDGVLRYTANLYPSHFCFPDQEVIAGSGPPIPSIVGNIITLIMGFALWRATGWLALMLGALIMFAAASVPIPTFGMAASNAGEVMLMLAYGITIWRFGRGRPRAQITGN